MWVCFGDRSSSSFIPLVLAAVSSLPQPALPLTDIHVARARHTSRISSCELKVVSFVVLPVVVVAGQSEGSV